MRVLPLVLVLACTPVGPDDKTAEPVGTTTATPEPTTPSAPAAPVPLDGLGFVIPAPRGEHPTALDLGDVTGDGVLDLFDIERQTDGHRVRVLAGPLRPGMDLSVPDGTVAFDETARGSDCTDVGAAGDVDGDGVGDVVCSGYEGGYEADFGRSLVKLGPLLGEVDAPSLQLWAGDSTFSRAPVHASLGDVDGDGDDEVAVGWPGHPPTGEVVVADVGVGIRAELSLPGTAGLGQALAPAGDVDGDGIVDLLVGGAFSDRVQLVRVGPWLAGAPSATFVTELQVPEAPSEMHLAGGGDVDGDGIGDLLVASRVIGGHTCLIPGAVSPGSFLVDEVATTCWEAPERVAPHEVELIDDLDGDGRSELVLVRSAGRVVVLPGADAVAGAALEDGLVLLGDAAAVRVGDVDADGVPDLVLGMWDDEVRVVPGVQLQSLLP